MGTTKSTLTYEPEHPDEETITCGQCSASVSVKMHSHFFPGQDKEVRVLYDKVTGGGDTLKVEGSDETVQTTQGEHLVKAMQKAKEGPYCVPCYATKNEASFNVIRPLCSGKAVLLTGSGTVFKTE